jgi:putative transposase
MRGFRYRLVPTNEQQVLLRQHVGVWRLVYNLALEQRRNWWRGGRSFSYASQCRELTVLRAAFDWIGCCFADMPAASIARP